MRHFVSGVLIVLACALGLASVESSAASRAIPATGQRAPFDRAFIDAMVPHHRSAIQMAKTAKRAGLSKPALVRIANAIIKSQGREISQMLSWRKRWYGSSRIDPQGAMKLGLSMDEMGMSHKAGDLMREKDVNRAFASMMLDHHEGAVRTARLAVKKGEHPALRTLARGIIAAQTREIQTLKRYAGKMHMHS